MSNAIAILKKLEAVGFEHPQAAAIVEAVEAADDTLAKRLATKEDLAELGTDMARMETRLYRALWLQTGAIVAAVAGLLTIVERITNA